MDDYVCPWCTQDTLEMGGDMVAHLESCDAFQRTMFPEKYNHESPLCDGDEE